MHVSTLWKTLPFAVLLVCLQAPSAMAGATNRDDNTTATPGDKSTTTESATKQEHDRRKGTTNTQDMQTPKKGSDKSKTKSGSDAKTDTDSGMGD